MIGLRVGTRSSLLARTQTDWVVNRLREAHPGLNVEITTIETTGDRRSDIPFAQVGAKGMFVKELEQALIDGAIDLAVHSLKDMPSDLPDGLSLLCVPTREEPRDVLIARHAPTLDALEMGATVGTSSLRRKAQLILYRADLNVIELRGNLDTRIRKLDSGAYDAIVVAGAGLHRLGLTDRVTQIIPVEVMVPAVGQGALALEGRVGDARVADLLAQVNDPDFADAAACERAFQKALDGGCSVPAGALASIQGDRISLVGLIAAADGSVSVFDKDEGERSEAIEVGRRLAVKLLDGGGRRLLHPGTTE